jgi:hypothetical protein
MPSDATEEEFYTAGAMRMRHAIIRFDSPVVNVFAGQFDDLFGWGGTGFYPNTLAFLGVPGEVFHRQPQIRLFKTLKSEAIKLDAAVAVTRPVQAASGWPDGQAGVRLAINDWKGPRTQGYGQPLVAPMAIGVSAMARRFEVADFIPQPGDSSDATGWGVVANVLLPIIPASSDDDRGNSLTVTAEYNMGSGIADMYTGLTNNARFPALPNPGLQLPAPAYPQNIDSGIATFNSRNDLELLNTRGLVIGAQYYLPVMNGRVWVSAIYSQLEMDNLRENTPIPSRGLVFTKSEYMDGSLFIGLTEVVQMGFGFQTVKTTYADGVSARNNRLEAGLHLFF